jgi:hypothetical protein
MMQNLLDGKSMTHAWRCLVSGLIANFAHQCRTLGTAILPQHPELDAVQM